MDRTQKEEMVSFLKGVFDTSASIVVVRNLGLNVSEMSDLRNQMREEGATLKVTKNRLARLALEG
ncbi:MAG: 50S ribosomal protein L10, partial [Kordiimonadaceae bacterium]|nr:50S ribosomal protein L10 [Kordiimonadaceae bacterium]